MEDKGNEKELNFKPNDLDKNESDTLSRLALLLGERFMGFDGEVFRELIWKNCSDPNKTIRSLRDVIFYLLDTFHKFRGLMQEKNSNDRTDGDVGVRDTDPTDEIKPVTPDEIRRLQAKVAMQNEHIKMLRNFIDPNQLVNNIFSMDPLKLAEFPSSSASPRSVRRARIGKEEEEEEEEEFTLDEKVEILRKALTRNVPPPAEWMFPKHNLPMASNAKTNEETNEETEGEDDEKKEEPEKLEVSETGQPSTDSHPQEQHHCLRMEEEEEEEEEKKKLSDDETSQTSHPPPYPQFQQQQQTFQPPQQPNYSPDYGFGRRTRSPVVERGRGRRRPGSPNHGYRANRGRSPNRGRRNHGRRRNSRPQQRQYDDDRYGAYEPKKYVRRRKQGRPQNRNQDYYDGFEDSDDYGNTMIKKGKEGRYKKNRRKK